MSELSIWRMTDVVKMLRWARGELRRNEEEHEALVQLLRGNEKLLAAKS